jgi:hypothetical protein
MRTESKAAESATDRHLGPLASLVRAAEPLEELSAVERERIKHRLRSGLLSSHRPAAGLRWSTALAALGLLLAGGVVFAAAGHFGLIPWPREAKPRVGSEPTGGRTQRRPVRGVRPNSVAAPPVIEPPPAAEPALTPLASAPVAAIGSGRPVAMLAPASTSPRAVRSSHGTPSRAASTPGVATRQQAGEALQSPHNEASALAPPAAEPVLTPPVSAPVALPEAGARVAMATPGSSSQRPVRVSHSPSPAPSAAASPDAQTMLGKAMRSLRNDRDPAGALDILARHAALFPQSPLASERSVLEVEALLAMGRNDEALLRLDGMSLDNTPRSAERYVVRGELRARAQRWPEAGADFDRALAHGRGASPWQERALWGRAVTRTQSGDQAGARADLQLYLQIYPAGRFASEAARLLAAAR